MSKNKVADLNYKYDIDFMASVVSMISLMNNDNNIRLFETAMEKSLNLPYFVKFNNGIYFVPVHPFVVESDPNYDSNKDSYINQSFLSIARIFTKQMESKGIDLTNFLSGVEDIYKNRSGDKTYPNQGCDVKLDNVVKNELLSNLNLNSKKLENIAKDFDDLSEKNADRAKKTKISACRYRAEIYKKAASKVKQISMELNDEKEVH